MSSTWEGSRTNPHTRITKNIRELLKFKYRNYNIIYPRVYYQFLREVFVFDVYQTNLIHENDVVLDLGASIGDFSILASKKVGKNGKVIAIEPNVEDYKLLRLNIKRNSCQNIIPLNQGVGGKVEEKEITFWDRTFLCKINTLENILDTLNIHDKINFIKMDIEGFEVDVISKSIEIIKNTNVIALEFHATKERLDELLSPYGFLFKPLTTGYIYKKMLKNLFLSPRHFYKASVDTIINNPRLIYKVFTGYDISKNDNPILVGNYLRGR